MKSSFTYPESVDNASTVITLTAEGNFYHGGLAFVASDDKTGYPASSLFVVVLGQPHSISCMSKHLRIF